MFLITPNPVFRHYIANVLPDMGERNPETLTLAEFARTLLPQGQGFGKGTVDEATFGASTRRLKAAGSSMSRATSATFV